MKDFEWLYVLCDPFRPNLDAPKSIMIDDELHALATNGSLLVIVKGTNEFQPFTQIDMVRKFVSLAKAGRRADLASIQAWAGPPSTKDPKDCEKCGSKGQITCTECNGSGEVRCTCPDCEHEHGAECDMCNGYGTMQCPYCKAPGTINVRRGLFCGKWFNRELFARALRKFSDEYVKVYVCQENLAPVHIAGSGWHASIMPLNMDRRIDDAPEWDFPSVRVGDAS